MNEIHCCRASIEHRIFRNDKAHFGKGVYAFSMDTKESLRWYDRLIALFFGVQWAQLTVRDTNDSLNEKTIYVRISHLAAFLKKNTDEIAKLDTNELAERFYRTKNAEKRALQVSNADPMAPAINKVRFQLELVLSLLDLPSLGQSCLVCQHWYKIAKKPLIWKTVIYRTLAFNNDKWAQYFGKEVVANEDRDQEFQELPLRIADEYKKFRLAFPPTYPHRYVKDSLMLVRLPKTLNGELTLNSFGELVMPQVDFYESIPQVLGDQPIKESYWVLMFKRPLPESENKSYAEQQAMVANLTQKGLIGYRIPKTLEATVCIVSESLNKVTLTYTGLTHLFTGSDYINCEESVQGLQVLVGGFDKDGLKVTLPWRNEPSLYHGVTVVREFS